MNIYIPFTYIIGWSKHKKFYYGAKYAQGCQPSDLWESYFTSSEYVKEFRKKFGEPDIIKIHKIFDDKDSCVMFETQYLSRIDAKNHPSFLNKSNGKKNFGGVQNHSEVTKTKIKNAMKEIAKNDIEFSKKMSEAGKKIQGKRKTEQHKANMSKARKGVPKSNSFKEQVSNTLKGRLLRPRNTICKKWKITNLSTKQIFIVEDRKLFCEQNNIKYSCFNVGTRNGVIYKKVWLCEKLS